MDSDFDNDDDDISITSTIQSVYSEDAQFEVERILAENSKQFLVKWDGYSILEATWEPKSSLKDLKPILTAWQDRKQAETQGVKTPFDIEEWEEQIIAKEEEAADRKKRRAAKRKRLKTVASSQAKRIKSDVKSSRISAAKEAMHDFKHDSSDEGEEASVVAEAPRMNFKNPRGMFKTPRRKLANTRSSSRLVPRDDILDDEPETKIWKVEDHACSRSLPRQQRVPAATEPTIAITKKRRPLRTSEHDCGEPADTKSGQSQISTSSAIRGSSSALLTSRRNVFQSADQSELCHGRSTKSKTDIARNEKRPKKLKQGSQKRRTELQVRNVADRAPNPEAIGGLFDPSKPHEPIKLGTLRRLSLNQPPAEKSTRDVELGSPSVPETNDGHMAPSYIQPPSESIPRNNLICPFWDYQQRFPSSPGCARGYLCKNLHEYVRGAGLAYGLATCFFWDNAQKNPTGSCRFDEKCKFLHRYEDGLPINMPPKSWDRTSPKLTHSLIYNQENTVRESFLRTGSPTDDPSRTNSKFIEPLSGNQENTERESSLFIGPPIENPIPPLVQEPALPLVRAKVNNFIDIDTEAVMVSADSPPIAYQPKWHPEAARSDDQHPRNVSKCEFDELSSGQGPSTSVPSALKVPEATSRQKSVKFADDKNLEATSTRSEQAPACQVAKKLTVATSVSALDPISDLRSKLDSLVTNECGKRNVIGTEKETAKEVSFADEQMSSIVLDFGEIGTIGEAEQAWQQPVRQSRQVHFNQLCIAQDFQKFYLQHSELWQGKLNPVNPNDSVAATMIEFVVDQLDIRCAGLLSLIHNVAILLFPAKKKEWAFLEKSFEHDGDVRLRYSIFPHEKSLLLGSVARGPGSSYSQILFEKIYNLRFKDLIPFSEKAASRYKFYLFFPPAASHTARFLALWIHSHNPDHKIFRSQSEGSWEMFLQSKDPMAYQGIVLVHELAVAQLYQLPNLFAVLAREKLVFRFLSEGVRPYPPFPSRHHIENLEIGRLSSTILFPHGAAILLTPSFLLAEPGTALNFLMWFKRYKFLSFSSPWRLAGCHDLPQYVLNLATSKATEAGNYESRHLRDPRKDSIMEERGLDFSTCRKRFELYTQLMSLMDTCSDDLAISQDEIESPIVCAPPSVDPDEEKDLVRWFAGWSAVKSDIFRKFVVIGTGPASSRRAKYPKKFARNNHSPKQRKSPNNPEKMAIDNDPPRASSQAVQLPPPVFASSPVNSKKADYEIRDHTFCPTTEWYKQWQECGEAWEHVFVGDHQEALNKLKYVGSTIN